MEETEESVNFITCALWVPRGAAKTNPDKVRATGTGVRSTMSLSLEVTCPGNFPAGPATVLLLLLLLLLSMYLGGALHDLNTAILTIS